MITCKARRKVVFMCVEVGGLGKCRRKIFWGNLPSIGEGRGLWSVIGHGLVLSLSGVVC